MRLYISINANADSSFKTKTVEGFGLVIYNGEGQISVLSKSPYSPAKHSITSFEVKESARNKGLGERLLRAAIDMFKEDIGAQVSSLASLRLMFKNGFRVALDPTLSIGDAAKMMREDSSVYMRFKPHLNKSTSATTTTNGIQVVPDVEKFVRNNGYTIKRNDKDRYQVSSSSKGVHVGNLLRHNDVWRFYEKPLSEDDAETKARNSDLPPDFNV